MRAALIVLAIAGLRNPAAAEPSAEDLYAEGQAAYDHADYPTAIAHWRASYEISGQSGLLFNLAQALRLSGDCPGALSTYRNFVAADADPTSEQHRLAEDLARELDATCGESQPTQPTQIRVTPVEPPVAASSRASAPGLDLDARLGAHDDRTTPPGRTLRVTGVATSGVGVALLVTGLVVGRHASALGNEVTDACASGCDWEAQKSKDAAGRRDATIGHALDIVGVAAIAGGAILYYVGVRETVTVAPRPGGGTVSWSESW